MKRFGRHYLLLIACLAHLPFAQPISAQPYSPETLPQTDSRVGGQPPARNAFQSWQPVVPVSHQPPVLGPANPMAVAAQPGYRVAQERYQPLTDLPPVQPQPSAPAGQLTAPPQPAAPPPANGPAAGIPTPREMAAPTAPPTIVSPPQVNLTPNIPLVPAEDVEIVLPPQPQTGSVPTVPSSPPHNPAATQMAEPVWQPCDPFHHYDPSAFCPDPDYTGMPYDAHTELSVYQGKWWNPTQRPLIELGQGLYRNGPVRPPIPFLSDTNLLVPHFLMYGDYRMGVGITDNGPDNQEFSSLAHRLNLDFDLRLTATERIHAFWGPIDEDGRYTRAEFRDDNLHLFEEFDDDFDTLFFEGDLGYLYGGMTDQMAPFDLPFVVGKFPLLFQNGVWFLDVVEGFAFTFPAKNSPLLQWSNFDLTVFFLFEDIDSAAFTDDEDADAIGMNLFLEAYDGYFEIGYAFLNDRTNRGLSYHNATFAYTRRYFHRVSNSVRVIVNAGQDPVNGADTADGTAILIENALISPRPLVFVPYLNLFAGFGRPQQVAGNAMLFNTGITFETDFLTGLPTLDATANDTYGGAAGINLLGNDFSWQMILEVSTVQTFNDDPNRNAVADQYGFGMRFQMPLTNAWLIRMDSIYGLLEDAPDVRGSRMELRWKF